MVTAAALASCEPLTPTILRAHTFGTLRPEEVWTAWGTEPWALLALGIATWLYARGVGRVWRRAGPGRGIRPWQFRAFCAGVVASFVAFASPLHAMGGVLFSAHMLQHEVLILVAAPLLVLGAPLVAFAWALPPGAIRAIGRVLRAPPIPMIWALISSPPGAWALHAVALWVWHVPSLYEATLSSEAAHALQHASFFGSALLLWYVLLHRMRQPAWGYGAAALVIFTTMLHSNVLGALLTFAPAPWYTGYESTAPIWGLAPLEDQQLGGLLMWIPAGTVYLVVMLVLMYQWLETAPTSRPRDVKPGAGGPEVRLPF